MANVKISGLPSATTPLTGAELVPVVQGGVTSQTTVGDFGAAVSYLPSGTGAVETTVQTKLRETVSVKDFGAVGDGVTDDTVAIQAAVNAASGKALYFPSGTYLLGTITLSPYGRFENYFILLPANITIYGDGDTSVLKIKNGMFTPTNVQANAHIFEGYDVTGVSISGLCFDQNGANNLEPGPAGTYTRNAMAIRIVRGSNVQIYNNKFLNCSGHNFIALVGPGSVANISNNRLYNGGKYVGTATPNTYNSDFTFIYTEWEKSIVSENHIEQQDVSIALTGYTGGVEIHNSYSQCTNNTIIGCDPAIWIASAISTGAINLTDITISGNNISSCQRGIAFYQNGNTNNVIINNNNIVLTNLSSNPGVNSYGIQVPNGAPAVTTFNNANANAAPISNLIISNNQITSDKSSTYYAAAIIGMYLHSLHNAKIVNNLITGLNYFGVGFQGSPWGLQDVLVEGNKIMDCGTSDFTSVAPWGIWLQSWGTTTSPAKGCVTKNLYIQNNSFGNTHTETYSTAGVLQTISCEGRMRAAIVVASLTSTSLVENLYIQNNTYTNIEYNIYGGTTPQYLEGQNSGAHFIPDVIYWNSSTFDKLRHIFGSEIVYYPTLGTRYKFTSQGNINSDTFTGTVSSGSKTVTVNTSAGLRVGMFITIAGAGAAGATLYAFIRAIVDTTTITIETAASTGVSGAAIAIYSPGPVSF